MSLALSCVVLIWGICRMVRFVGSMNNIMANKVTIIMHIVAYLFIIVANATQTMLYFGSIRAFEISTICNLVVYFFCTFIFGIIVNTIVTEI